MTPKEFIRQLDTAQSIFADTVSKIAMEASLHKDQAPYKPGIARCVATLNILESAGRFDWNAAASKEGTANANGRPA